MWLYTFLVVVLATLAWLVWSRRSRQPGAKQQAAPLKPSKYSSVSSSDFHSRTDDEYAGVKPDPLVMVLPGVCEATRRFSRRVSYTVLKSQKLAARRLRSGRIRDGLVGPGRVSEVTHEQAVRHLRRVMATYPHYDATDPSLPALRRFTHVRRKTSCIFARSAAVWGSPALRVDEPVPSVTSQTLRALPGLVQFVLRVKDSYPKPRADSPATNLTPAQLAALTSSQALLDWPTSLTAFMLDGFVIEVTGREHCATLSSFARTVRTVLATLSLCDPVLASESLHDQDSYGVDVSPVQCMASLGTSRSGEVFSSPRWHFSFLSEPFFVTCFAPCYDRDHARYMFADESGEMAEEMRQRCFVLLQPELAFLRRDLAPDTPHTSWDAPRTDRDRVRIAFRKAGREYPVPPTTVYPPAHAIVPPLDWHSGEVVRWWEADSEDEEDNEEQHQAKRDEPDGT